MKKMAMLTCLIVSVALVTGCSSPVKTELEGIWTSPDQVGSATIHLNTIELSVPIDQSLGKMADKDSGVSAQATVKGKFSIDESSTPKSMTIHITGYGLEEVSSSGLSFEQSLIVTAVRAGVGFSKLILALPLRLVPITLTYSLSGDDLTLEGLKLPFIVPMDLQSDEIMLHRTGTP